MQRWCCLGLLLLVLVIAGCLGTGDPTGPRLTVEVRGAGRVEPEVGTHRYNRGDLVELTATAADGWTFARWEGDVANPDSAATEVVIEGAETVTAVFFLDDASPAMRLAPAAALPTGIDDSGEEEVDKDFWIAKTQVTYELWYAVKQWGIENDYNFGCKGREGSHGRVGGIPTSNRREPVTMISWSDSIVWCNALSEMHGYEPVYLYDDTVIRDAENSRACNNAEQAETDGFRLPTSIEWELAARYRGTDSAPEAVEHGGLYWTPGSYASGAAASIDDAAATQKVAWYHANSASGTNKVGLTQANHLGVYDMSGNVWEWTCTGRGSERVIRGGSWGSNAATLQVGHESIFGRDDASNYLGFRVVQTQY